MRSKEFEDASAAQAMNILASIMRDLRMKRFTLFSLAFLSLAMCLSAANPQGDPPGTTKEKPKRLPSLAKEIPETIEDLRAMEKHTQKVLEQVTPSVVCIQMGGSSGSGVIVNATGTVLTAGHVSGQPGTNAFVILQNGKRLKAKSLGRNGGIDSGMMQILEDGPFPHVDMGSSADMKAGQWCVCVGHPGGLKLNRGLVVRIGRSLVRQQQFSAHRLLFGRRRFGRPSIQHARRSHRHS